MNNAFKTEQYLKKTIKQILKKRNPKKSAAVTMPSAVTTAHCPFYCNDTIKSTERYVSIYLLSKSWKLRQRRHQLFDSQPVRQISTARVCQKKVVFIMVFEISGIILVVFMCFCIFAYDVNQRRITGSSLTLPVRSSICPLVHFLQLLIQTEPNLKGWFPRI